jgi:alkyldihydroxyacetonephosphate synthase
MVDTYRACWRRTMDAVVSLGAGIAHHHGIGRVRRAHLPQELGPVGVDLLRAIKATLDPDSLLNPGALFPDP